MSTDQTHITTAQSSYAVDFREIWENYRSEVFFGLVVGLCVIASTYLSRFVPDEVFDNLLTPTFVVMTVSVCLGGAWIVLRHTDGMRMRRMWGYALLVWGAGDLVYLTGWMIAPMEVMNMGAARITTYELLLGNLLAWMLTLYPTETLRPGWMSPKIALLQLLPLFLLAALDYVIPLNLWSLIALYPFLLVGLVLRQIRAYQKWCEDNYSSMENIDAQWVIRYCIMLFILGVNFMYMCATHDHTRGLTQQWFVVFMLAYSTEQILFRKNPWAEKESSVLNNHPALSETDEQPEAEDTPILHADRVKLEEWMTDKKPYLNSDFQLVDLRAVLPTNRTYLSNFIHDEYDCSFYQFVNRYRIKEAQRLMLETPDMKLGDVAERSGFASPSAFCRVFSRETGFSPSEWVKQNTV